jgi:4,4'-diaponeurosporenoate glycosyltransferase
VAIFKKLLITGGKKLSYSSLIVLFAGLVSGILLFLRRPILPDEELVNSPKKISVIIPARNEGNNLPSILQDLSEQSAMIYEIICVDDDSADKTAEIAESFGATLIKVTDKPEGWTGKSFACQTGANYATGELLLFLDADVRLQVNAVQKIEKAYEKSKCVISVQPFHTTIKVYEQLSLYFNLIMIAANGVGLPFRKKNIGLFGPVILISRKEYYFTGGHSSVKKSIADDLSFGENLIEKGIKFVLFLGGKDISFRMYDAGFKQLQQGWTKNIATGASKTSLTLLLMTTLWLASGTTAVLNYINLITDFSFLNLGLDTILYFIVVAELWIAAQKVGNFKKSAIIFFPFPLLFFFIILILSLAKKVFHIKVKWKGRKI